MIIVAVKHMSNLSFKWDAQQQAFPLLEKQKGTDHGF